MTNLMDEPLSMFLQHNGILPPISIDRILAGRNSEVHKISNASGAWVLKNYYQHVSDKRDRLGVEFSFLKFLENADLSMVCRPLGMDRVLQSAIYSYLIGKRPVEVTTAHISQAGSFIKKINMLRNEPDALLLPKAADACLSFQAHMNLTELRIERLLAVQPKHDLEKQMHKFLKEKLLPSYIRFKEKIDQKVSPCQFRLDLPLEEQIISPSDFGLHNALENQGELFFLDFEYAGWDDPAKLICDFICQPELPITQSQSQQFISELLPQLPSPDKIKNRVEILLPLHRLKWCCILLNEFRVEDRNRRMHAGLEQDRLLEKQFGKAQWYFDTHLTESHKE